MPIHTRISLSLYLALLCEPREKNRSRNGNNIDKSAQKWLTIAGTGLRNRTYTQFVFLMMWNVRVLTSGFRAGLYVNIIQSLLERNGIRKYEPAISTQILVT